jgi:dipeptidyl-peptidase-3
VSDTLTGTPQAALKEQFSALEKGRADLVGLYFFADPKLAEFGIVPAADQQAIVLAEYESYARTAIVQLRRVRQGTEIPEDHMRPRQAGATSESADSRVICSV